MWSINGVRVVVAIAALTLVNGAGSVRARAEAPWVASSSSPDVASTTFTDALGTPPDAVADAVYGQLGSFTTNSLNAGGLSANSLWLPTGVAVDRDGDVYISDNGNSRILVFPPGSTTATRVYGQHGSLTSGFGNNGGLSAESLLFPESLTLDSDGNLYVADRNNNRVLFYPRDSTTATRVYGQGGSFTTNLTNGGVVPPTANQLFGPYDVAVDAAGNVYIADTGNHRILFFPPGSTLPTRVYGQLGDFNTGVSNKGGRSADTFSFPRGLAFDSGGNLYVVDRNNHRILVFPPESTTAFRVYGQDGDFTTAIGGVTATRLFGPDGIALDRHDNVYVVDNSNHRVLFFPAGSTTATQVYGQDASFTTALPNKGGLSADSLLSPGALALDPIGNLWVTDRLNHRVLRYDRPPDTVAPTAMPTQAPPANAAGWNNTDVSVEWHWSDDDGGTGIDEAACPASTTSSSEGAAITVSSGCRDYAGNDADAAQVVNIDKTPPTLDAAATTSPNAGGWYRTDVTIAFTCSDGLSGVSSCPANAVLTAEGASIQSSPLTATDVAGNASAPSPIVLVSIDRTAPLLALVGGPFDWGSYTVGTVPAATACEASDSLSGLAGPCSISGYGTTAGTHTLTASAADIAGNHTSLGVTYTVAAQASTVLGFYEPIDMGGVWNVVKAGATVPLKFEVFAGAEEVIDVAAVLPLTAQQTLCDDGSADDLELVSAGNTVLRYDAAEGRFIYNWKTPKAAGTCYVVRITAIGGASLEARVRLK